MQTQNKEKSETKEETVIASAPNWPAGIVISKKESMSVSVADDLAVILSKDAFEQLFCWAYSTPREISCLGVVSRDSNRFVIERFYLLKQSGSSASTELDQVAVAELLEKLIAEGKKEEAGRIKCWAHSHPDAGVFWSNTDSETCRLLVNDYLISIVVSDNFAIRCRIDIAAPVALVIDNVPVIYRIPKDELATDKYADEVRKAVSERIISSPKRDNLQIHQQDESIPASYCGYCGNFHLDGECPLGDVQNWPQVLDEDDFMF